MHGSIIAIVIQEGCLHSDKKFKGNVSKIIVFIKQKHYRSSHPDCAATDHQKLSMDLHFLKKMHMYINIYIQVHMNKLYSFFG